MPTFVFYGLLVLAGFTVIRWADRAVPSLIMSGVVVGFLWHFVPSSHPELLAAWGWAKTAAWPWVQQTVQAHIKGGGF